MFRICLRGRISAVTAKFRPVPCINSHRGFATKKWSYSKNWFADHDVKPEEPEFLKDLQDPKFQSDPVFQELSGSGVIDDSRLEDTDKEYADNVLNGLEDEPETPREKRLAQEAAASAAEQVEAEGTGTQEEGQDEDMIQEMEEAQARLKSKGNDVTQEDVTEYLKLLEKNSPYDPEIHKAIYEAVFEEVESQKSAYLESMRAQGKEAKPEDFDEKAAAKNFMESELKHAIAHAPKDWGRDEESRLERIQREMDDRDHFLALQEDMPEKGEKKSEKERLDSEREELSQRLQNLRWEYQNGLEIDIDRHAKKYKIPTEMLMDAALNQMAVKDVELGLDRDFNQKSSHGKGMRMRPSVLRRIRSRSKANIEMVRTTDIAVRHVIYRINRESLK